jgi:hypothetical protein
MTYKIVGTRIFCIVYRIAVNILMHCAFEPEAHIHTFVTEYYDVLSLRRGYHNLFRFQYILTANGCQSVVI